MAKYQPIEKTLKRATPTIRTADNVVKSWEVEVIYSYAGDEAQGLPAWKTTYTEHEDVEYLNKTATEFTQAELMSFMSSTIQTDVFEAHYEAFNLPPAEHRVSDFDLNTLSNS